ncbi:ZIP family metal transporter [Patescibacteria group bacterium]
MSPWHYSLISVLIVSLLSFIGVLFLAFKLEKLRKILLFLVSFAAGGLLGDAFIHLLPETIEKVGFNLQVSLSVLSGLLLFFVMEKFIRWRHCHEPTCDEHPHPVAMMNLIGDGFHNFMDGLLIAASFCVSFSLGLATTLAIVLHEIPQEIGDFGVLIHAGFSKAKAILFNFLTALTAILGVLVALALNNQIEGFTQILLPFTAGGFIYIAGSDLIPELKKETEIKKSAFQLLGLVLGIGVMLALTVLE